MEGKGKLLHHIYDRFLLDATVQLIASKTLKPLVLQQPIHLTHSYTQLKTIPLFILLFSFSTLLQPNSKITNLPLNKLKMIKYSDTNNYKYSRF